MKISTSLLCTILILLLSCQQEELYEEVSLMLSKTYERVPAASGNLNVHIQANSKWTYNTQADWVNRLDKTNDSTLTISYQSNSTNGQQIADIRISTGPVSKSFMLEQDYIPTQNIPHTLPVDLIDHLGTDSLYILSPTILISKGGRYASSVTKADFSSTLLGWTVKSINPILLQMGLTIDRSNLKMYYVELPEDFQVDNDFYIYGTKCRETRTGPFHVTDENGNRLKNTAGQDSTIKLHCQTYRILMGKGIESVPNPGGVTCCWVGKIHISRSIVLNEGASSNVVAHEIGHTIGLEHTDQNGRSCSHDIATKYLMRSISYPNSQLLKTCENRVSTSRSIFATRGIKAFIRFEKAFAPGARAIHRKKIGDVNAPSVLDVVTGWAFITKSTQRREYIQNVTYYTHSQNPQASQQQLTCSHDLYHKK